MYLKNLTLFGFKSFADKTALNFQPGVTAIVGPNGCGKSNVSDAIRWVLGEQSAKALRGGEMADVIFNGTESRRSMGLGEVSLTLSDMGQENLRAAGVEVPYDEVTLTRRIFRDGNSEYFLNRTPCRLKDIQQLFMGTGVGRTSYSILAQGHITQILSSKPEDRRLIFEEAAGITKFKSQKKESLRKLEYTEQNLLRVADLIREVKRQIGSLQRQAGKARRYKQISQELQHLDTQLARHQFDVLQAEIAGKQGAVEKLRNEIEQGAQEVSRLEDEIAHLRGRLSELEHEVAAQQQRGLELKAESDRHESRIQFNEERLREIAAQNARALADITQAEERSRAAQEELAAVTGKTMQSEAALAQHRLALDAKQKALGRVEEDLKQRQEALREAQAEAFAAAQDSTRIRNEITALDLQKQGNVRPAGEIVRGKNPVGGGARAAGGAPAGILAPAWKRRSSTRRPSAARWSSGRSACAKCRWNCKDRPRNKTNFCSQQAEKRSHLGVLEQLEGAREGFDAGAVAALRQSRTVIGSLADRIRVPEEYVVAIENALGHHLQFVLTAQPESAQKVLAELNASKAGRASVAALAICKCVTTSSSPSKATCRRAAAWATSGALGQRRSGAGVERRPGRSDGGQTFEVVAGADVHRRGFADGDGADSNGHAGCDFVTLAGDLLSRHGVYTGGYLNGNGNPKAPGSILGRKNQIADLQAELIGLRERVAEMSRRRGALAERADRIAGGPATGADRIARAGSGHRHARRRIQRAAKLRRLLHQKIETVVFEIQSLAAHEQEGWEKRNALAAQLSELEARERAGQEKVAALTADLENLRQQRDAANAALTESHVALATEEQFSASFGSRNSRWHSAPRTGACGGTAAERISAFVSARDRRRPR